MAESQIVESGDKLVVPIEYILWLDTERRKINRVNLAKIVFTENGEPLDIPTKRVDRFKFVGLSNTDFILTDFYKEQDDDASRKGLTE